MKKIISILFLVLLISGCSRNDNELNIVVPSGAPSLAFYSEINNPLFNTSDAKSILADMLANNGSDIVVVDTVSGLKAIAKANNYYLAANITFGNFYLASTGNDDNGVLDKDDYIVLFSQGATPDIIFHYLYGNEYDDNIHYVSNVNDALVCLNKGINIMDEERSIDEDNYVDYVMIAEPALTVAISQNDRVTVYDDIQDLYFEKTGKQMIQASVFISKKLDNKVAKEYLNKLKSNIEQLLNNPSLFEDTMVANNIGDNEIKDIYGIPNTKIVSKVLQNNTIGLDYIDAYSNLESIDTFISLFGLDATDEEIYFK